MANSGNLNPADYPHLNEAEWAALYRLTKVIGEDTVTKLLLTGEPDSHVTTARTFIQHEKAHAFTSAPKTVKMEVVKYRGTEQESLPRWFVEIETAFYSQQIKDVQMQVAFAMSNLAGRARSWAFGKRMANPQCFVDFLDFRKEIEDAFQPPKSEFRQRSKFLAIKQGKRDLHEYVQEARYLASIIVQEPMDDATQVSVFLNGLVSGPVRTQLFREYPNTLEEAISKALQEDFSLKQSKQDGFYFAPKGRTSNNYSRNNGSSNYYSRNIGAEPMDLSYANMTRKPNVVRKKYDSSSKRTMECHRCGKLGHLSYECRAPAPVSRNRDKKSQGSSLSSSSSQAKNEKDH